MRDALDTIEAQGPSNVARELEDPSKSGAIFTHASDSTKKHIGKYQVSGLYGKEQYNAGFREASNLSSL